MGSHDQSLTQSLELVAGLLAGETPTGCEIEALLRMTSPYMSWQSYDRAIRTNAGPHAWQQASPDGVDTALALAMQHEPEVTGTPSASASVLRPAVAQILSSHPDGRIRLRAVHALGSGQLPLPLVERALDWVPAVRELAASALQARWQTAPGDSLGIVAANSLVSRAAAIRRCPALIPLAVDVAGSEGATTTSRTDAMRVFWTQERRRRANERLRYLRSVDCDATRPEQGIAKASLIAFHESRLRSAS